MEQQYLQKLFPELDTEALALDFKHPSLRSAMADLATAEAELARCASATKEKEDWEATKGELLDEIRRMTRSLSRKT